MAAHVSFANGDPVLLGQIPETIAALTERVKSVPPFIDFCSHPFQSSSQVLKIEEDVKISLQYQNEGGQRVDLSCDSDIKARTLYSLCYLAHPFIRLPVFR